MFIFLFSDSSECGRILVEYNKQADNKSLPIEVNNSIGIFNYIGQRENSEKAVYLLFKNEQCSVLHNFEGYGWRASVSAIFNNGK